MVLRETVSSSGCHLLPAYVGQELRRDLKRLEGDVELSEFIDSLARHGDDETVIAEAIAEVKGR